MWNIEDRFRAIIGSNTYINTPSIITVKGEPLFTLKRRESDGVLGIDFDIFDKDGVRVATVRNSNVVQGNESDYDIVRGADHYVVTEKATSRVICDLRKKTKAHGAEIEISVNMYTKSGFLLEATPKETNLAGATVRNCVFQDCPTAIAIG